MASEDCFEWAHDGDLEGLKAARQNGCPWGTRTCSGAAWGGHLPVLQWARQNGCPWKEESIQSNLQHSSNQLHTFYGPRRWLERELNISWSSSIVQWMDEIDEIDETLDGMLISDLSSLIKKYV